MFRQLLYIPRLGSQRLCSQQTDKIKEIIEIRRFPQHDLDIFSLLTREYNPIHSAPTPVEERVVQGALLNSVVIGIISEKLTGPGSILLEQNYRLPKPCRIDTDVDILVRLLEDRKISVVDFECRQGEDLVLEGQAKILVKK